MTWLPWPRRCALAALLACGGCGSPARDAPRASSPPPSASALAPAQPVPKPRPLSAADRQKSAEVIENAIRKILRKPTGPLTAADRQRITELYLIGENLADLAPLAGLPRLQVLNLRDNRITDLRPLARLTQLQKLGLDSNQVVDLGPLGELKNLRQLEISGNPHLAPAQLLRLRQALPSCRILAEDMATPQ